MTIDDLEKLVAAAKAPDAPLHEVYVLRRIDGGWDLEGYEFKDYDHAEGWTRADRLAGGRRYRVEVWAAFSVPKKMDGEIKANRILIRKLRDEQFVPDRTEET